MYSLRVSEWVYGYGGHVRVTAPFCCIVRLAFFNGTHTLAQHTYGWTNGMDANSLEWQKSVGYLSLPGMYFGTSHISRSRLRFPVHILCMCVSVLYVYVWGNPMENKLPSWRRGAHLFFMVSVCVLVIAWMRNTHTATPFYQVKMR